jgi:hypothetical protein
MDSSGMYIAPHSSLTHSDCRSIPPPLYANSILFTEALALSRCIGLHSGYVDFLLICIQVTNHSLFVYLAWRFFDLEARSQTLAVIEVAKLARSPVVRFYFSLQCTF